MNITTHIDASEAMRLGIEALRIARDDNHAALALLVHAMAAVIITAAPPEDLPTAREGARNLGPVLVEAIDAMQRVSAECLAAGRA